MYENNLAKIYSFFGFWTYIEMSRKRAILYWIVFPWIKFYKTIDLTSWKLKPVPPKRLFREPEENYWEQYYN